MTPARFRVVASSVVFAMAGSSSAQSPTPPSSGENKVQLTGVIINAFGDGSEHVRKMRERLQDPQQRALLREEYRGYIVEANYDAAEVLELDAATYEKLIEVLTDQQMGHLDQFHLRGFSPSPSSSPDVESHLQSQIERQSRDLDALREVLGQQKLERFQAYQWTSAERRQLRELDVYLKSSDKLSRTQKDQLIELFRTHNRSMIQGFHSTSQLRSTLGALREMPSQDPRQMPSQEELQRSSQLMTIESNEDIWRRAPESDRKLREQAAAILTASQLSALEQLHADRSKQLQQTIERMRVQAGLSPNIPAAAEAEAAEPTPAQVARDVRVRLKIAVNRGKPATFTQIVTSGTPLTVEVDGGLLVQATPTVFDNDTYELHIEYFEQGTTGKRLIGSMGNVGTLKRDPPVADSLLGGGASVVSGTKAYAIELSSSVETT
jgi:hypothetical protein